VIVVVPAAIDGSSINVFAPDAMIVSGTSRTPSRDDVSAIARGEAGGKPRLSPRDAAAPKAICWLGGPKPASSFTIVRNPIDCPKPGVAGLQQRPVMLNLKISSVSGTVSPTTGIEIVVDIPPAEMTDDVKTLVKSEPLFAVPSTVPTKTVIANAIGAERRMVIGTNVVPLFPSTTETPSTERVGRTSSSLIVACAVAPQQPVKLAPLVGLKRLIKAGRSPV
jgi:hypothetical protein